MSYFDHVAALFILSVLFAVWVLIRAHYADTNTVDLTDLITYKGRVDNAKFCQIGAFLVSSWVVFYMTLKSSLTEWAFGLYMAAWVGARVASMWAGMKAQVKPGEIKT